MAVTTSGNNGGDSLTLEKVMQHIENLQQENEAMRKQANDEHARRQAHETRQQAEVDEERERLRKEASESRNVWRNHCANKSNCASVIRGYIRG